MPDHGDRAQRRARLVDAALDIVGAQRPAVPSVAQIADRAGLHQRFFVESFRTLDDCLNQILDDVGVEVADAIVSGVQAGGPVTHDPALMTDLDDETLGRVNAGTAGMVEVFVGDARKGRFALLGALALPSTRERRRQLLDGFAVVAEEQAQLLFGERCLPSRQVRAQSVCYAGAVAAAIGGWVGGTLDVSRDELVEALTRQFLLLRR